MIIYHKISINYYLYLDFYNNRYFGYFFLNKTLFCILSISINDIIEDKLIGL